MYHWEMFFPQALYSTCIFSEVGQGPGKAGISLYRDVCITHYGGTCLSWDGHWAVAYITSGPQVGLGPEGCEGAGYSKKREMKLSQLSMGSGRPC